MDGILDTCVCFLADIFMPGLMWLCFVLAVTIAVSGWIDPDLK